MSIQQSDLVSLAERLLIACDQSYAAKSLEVDTSYLAPDFDPPLGDKFKPPYLFEFPKYVVRNRIVNDSTGLTGQTGDRPRLRGSSL
jgi:hypothetical protein